MLSRVPPHSCSSSSAMQNPPLRPLRTACPSTNSGSLTRWQSSGSSPRFAAGRPSYKKLTFLVAPRSLQVCQLACRSSADDLLRSLDRFPRCPDWLASLVRRAASPGHARRLAFDRSPPRCRPSGQFSFRLSLFPTRPRDNERLTNSYPRRPSTGSTRNIGSPPSNPPRPLPRSKRRCPLSRFQRSALFS